MRKNNKSGVTGAGWVPRNRAWRVNIFFKGKHYSLGGYRSFEEAVKARKRAEEELYKPFLREFASTEVRNVNGLFSGSGRRNGSCFEVDS